MSVILLPPLRPVWVLFLALGVAASGCVHPPRFVRKSKMLGPMFQRSDKQSFIDSPNFSFEIDRDWIGPESNKLGVFRYRQPNGRATIDAVYLKTGTKGWVPLTKYYQRMRERGTVEDLHLLEDVKIYARAGKLVRYTTLKYDPRYRTGEKYEAFYAEEMVITDPGGYYVFRYHAEKKYFSKYHDVFNRALASMILEERKGEAAIDVFGGTRKKKSVADELRINRMEADEKFRKKRWEAALQLGLGSPVISDSVGGANDVFGQAYALNLQALYYPMERLGFGPELTYMQIQEKTTALGVVAGIDLGVAFEGTITGLGFVGRYNFPEKKKWKPYIVAGGGLYILELDFKLVGDFAASTCIDSSGAAVECGAVAQLKSTGLGATGGMGVEFDIWKSLSGSVEARLYLLKLDGKQLSGNLGYATGLAGLHYRYGK